MPNIVDLRSDTTTRPSLEMKKYMMEAELGDDVLGDDPTVIELQRRMAEMLGKEAALFVPTGSMANSCAIRSVCEPGDELIAEESTHCHNYETGSPAALAGVSMRSLRGRRGMFEAEQVEAVYRPVSPHFARSRMVVMENTSNRGGGSVWSLERTASISETARKLGLHLHIDGARLWNACVATGRAPAEYAALADTVSMCFSKGLGAPAGSILAGDAAIITRAHRFRKMFGGAMRQAGILAAAGLYAIEYNVERLAVDHENARVFAEAISAMPGIVLDASEVETNIIIFAIEPRLGAAQQFVDRLRERDIWMLATGPQTIRAVTHLDVSREGVERAIGAFGELCAQA